MTKWPPRIRRELRSRLAQILSRARQRARGGVGRGYRPKYGFQEWVRVVLQYAWLFVGSREHRISRCLTTAEENEVPVSTVVGRG